MPLDSFHRNINYLRVSLTDHCNLRCVYCMPMGDLEYLPRHDVLTAPEIETAVQAAADVGFNKIRLTGGEPTLRADLVDIVGRLASIENVGDLSLTTNGILLPRLAHDLRRAGLQRLNIHVDTLDPTRIERIMRFATIEDIWAGIKAAIDAGFNPIKLNAVVARGYNDADVVDLARLTLDRPWHVRFIELMPLGDGECDRFSRTQCVPSRESHQRIEAALGPLMPIENANPSDEARNYRLPDALGVVGFISPVSDPYCGACNRMRLTADGKLHLCLLHDDEIDLKPALRDHASIDEIRKIILEAVRQKPVGHDLDRGLSTQTKSMFQIGG